MKYFQIFLGIFITLVASRFIPHPPNFTSLIALSFYVPTLLGRKYIPAVILSFVLTDLIIGLHSTILFTWGSILIISLSSKFFKNYILNRLLGALSGAIIFFIVTNFGVWSLGSYGYTLHGIISCYILALPFFGYTIISTFLFSSLIETLYRFKVLKNFLKVIREI
tara:strand:+ start:2336 stop:2833 length:498 start_codon:yes stop_codon:yes gene_type:complete